MRMRFVEEPVNETSAVVPPLNQLEGETAALIEKPSGSAGGSGAVADSGGSWRAFGLLFNKVWWSNTLILCRIFAGSCALPAALTTAAWLSSFIGLYFAVSQIHTEIVQITSLFAAIGILLVTMVVAIVFLVSGFASWFLCWSTFCLVFCTLDMCSALPPQDEIRVLIASSRALILSRKKFLAQYYSLLLLIYSAPFIFWCILFVVKSLTLTSANSGLVSIKISLPPVVDVLICFILAVLGGYLAGSQCCAVVVSSNSNDSAQVAAWACVKLSIRNFFPMILLTAVVSILTTIIAAPQTLLHPLDAFSPTLRTTSLLESLCPIVWGGISSVVWVNLTFAPFCELLRYRLK